MPKYYNERNGRIVRHFSGAGSSEANVRNLGRDADRRVLPNRFVDSFRAADRITQLLAHERAKEIGESVGELYRSLKQGRDLKGAIHTLLETEFPEIEENRMQIANEITRICEGLHRL